LLLQSQYGELEENKKVSNTSANGSGLSQVDHAVNVARGLHSHVAIDQQLGIIRDSQVAHDLSETTVLDLYTTFIRHKDRY
jgi:hypothetical protein